MRLALLLVVAAVLALVLETMVPRWHSAGELRKARIEGSQDADRDIEKGTPWLRREFHTWGRLPRDGIGVDRETGLPLSNATGWCGTCEFLWGDLEDARDEGYNARMLEALAAGQLDGLRLDQKLKDKATLRTLFATGRPAVLKGDGDSAVVGRIEISCYLDEDLASFDIAPAIPGQEPHRIPRSDDAAQDDPAGRVLALKRFVDAAYHTIFLRYPWEFADAPKRLWMQFPPAPFEVLVVDDDTTLILRDGEGYAWVVDLPRSLILEVVGPIR